MTQEDAVTYWLETAEKSKCAAEDNFKTGHIDWSFFLWHLTIEKLLKGLAVKAGVTPPPIHNLLKLCEITGLKPDPKRFQILKEINTYCIEARYDDIKQKYYKKVTEPEYAKPWSKKCRETIIWIKKYY